jgi:hypothetical protein
MGRKLRPTLRNSQKPWNLSRNTEIILFSPNHGADIGQNTFCSLIRTQNEFLHNIKHVEIHGLYDIYLEHHIGNNINDGEEYSNNIRDLLLEEVDNQGQHLFRGIERTMKPDTTHALFSKQN